MRKHTEAGFRRAQKYALRRIVRDMIWDGYVVLHGKEPAPFVLEAATLALVWVAIVIGGGLALAAIGAVCR